MPQASANRLSPEEIRRQLQEALDARGAPLEPKGKLSPEEIRAQLQEALGQRQGYGSAEGFLPAKKAGRPLTQEDYAPTPGPLGSAAGSFLEAGADALRGVQIGIERLGGTATPALQGDINAMRRGAENVYPAATRGTGSFWGETIPAAIGGTAPSVISTAINPAIGTMVTASQMGAPVYDEILNKTGDPEKATKGALAVAAMAPLETLTGVGGSLSRLKAGKKGLWAFARTLLNTFSEEVPQEVAEQLVTDSVLESLTGEDREIFKNALATVPTSTVLAFLFGSARGLAENAGRREPAPAVQQPAGKTIEDVAKWRPAKGPEATLGFPAAPPARDVQAPPSGLGGDGEPGAPLPVQPAAQGTQPVAEPTASGRGPVPPAPLQAEQLDEEQMAPDRAPWPDSVAPHAERVRSGRLDISISAETHPDLKLYRGEPKGTETPFRPGDGAAGPGTYLAIHRRKAEVFAGPSGEVKEISAPNVRLLRVPANEAVNAKDWNKAARDLGYDGIWVDGQGEIVLFKPPQGTPTEGPRSTGIKNATVEQELADMGLPPPVKGEPKPDVELHRRAQERFNQPDRPAEKLLDSLEGKPRPVSDEDNALLTFEANRLIQDRKAAQEAFNADPSPENQAAVDKAQAAYVRAADIFDAIGTESGRSLRARRLMLNEDYSLAQMERELQVAKRGEELTGEERSKLAKISEDLEAATKRATDAETKVAALEAERALAKLKKQAAKLPAEKAPKPPRRSAIEKTKKEIEDIYVRMGERAKNRVHSGSGFGPDDIPDLVLLAGKHIKLGVQTFDAWAAEVVARLGEGIRPHLRGAWDEAQRAKGESRLKARRTRLEGEIKELERRIAEQDFTEKERKPLRADPETVRLKAEAEGLKREYRSMKRRAERASRTAGERIRAVLREVHQAPRELSTNYDFASIFNQGAFFALGQPFKTARQVVRMLNAFASEKRGLREMERLKAHPLYATAKAAGVPMMEWDSELSDGETHMASWIAKKFPGIRRFNRAYATQVNVMRHEKFYDMVRANFDEKRPPTQKELKDVAGGVSVLSGRGSLGKANAAMELLSGPFFSPRKIIGNIQTAVGTPVIWNTSSPRVRWAFAKQYARSAVGFSALVGLATMAGKAYGVDVEVGDDPEGPNFGKIKFGSKWYDPLGGLSQAFTFVYRQAVGEKKDADGKVTKLRGSGAGYKAGLMTAADYARSKASPWGGFAGDVIWGKDWLDRDITPLESAKEHFLPMTPHDLYKALQDEGFSEAAAETFVNMLGIRVRDYARGSR